MNCVVVNIFHADLSLQGSLEFLERTFSPGNLQSPGGSRRSYIEKLCFNNGWMDALVKHTLA